MHPSRVGARVKQRPHGRNDHRVRAAYVDVAVLPWGTDREPGNRAGYSVRRLAG
jgi:hypothetical protein